MKKLVFAFMFMLGMAFAACSASTADKTVEETVDTTEVVVDTLAVDTVSVDTVM